MLDILAQAAPQAPSLPSIEITLPAAITIAGGISLLAVIIRLGDRLWGKKEEPKEPKNNGIELQDLRDVLQNVMATHSASMQAVYDKAHARTADSNDKIFANVNKLSEAMTKYIELQQAALKIEEYRHDNMVKQIEVLAGQVVSFTDHRSKEFETLHKRLDSLLTSLVNKRG